MMVGCIRNDDDDDSDSGSGGGGSGGSGSGGGSSGGIDGGGGGGGGSGNGGSGGGGDGAKMYDHCSSLSASNVFFFLYKNPDFRVRMWTSDCQLSSCWARCFLNRTLSWQLKIKLYGLLT